MSNPSSLVAFPLGVAEKLRLGMEHTITAGDIHALLLSPEAKQAYKEADEWLRDNNKALFGPQTSGHLGIRL